MSSPILITSGTAATPAGTGTALAVATVPVVDINAQIEAVFEARQRILLALAALEQQRSDLGRSTAVAYSTDVAANGVDPAKAVIARDAWQTKDTQFATQQAALNQLLGLIEARIEEFKRTDPTEVSGVLREQIAALSEVLSTQEAAENSTERQLKVLWNELRDVDPGSLASMVKGSSVRTAADARKSAKPGAKK